MVHYIATKIYNYLQKTIYFFVFFLLPRSKSRGATSSRTPRGKLNEFRFLPLNPLKGTKRLVELFKVERLMFSVERLMKGERLKVIG